MPNPAALVRSKALTPKQIANAVRPKGPVGPGLVHSNALTPSQIAAVTKKTKGGKRSRRRRGTTRRTPKPKWASTRKYRRIHGGACGCSIPRGI
jgi:hypothetical protein